MENIKLYSFPAVGSLKEKRLAHFEPEHTAAKDAVKTLEEKVDKHEDPAKEPEVRTEIVEAEKKVAKAREKVADASDVGVAAKNVRELQAKIDTAKAKFEQKIIASVNKAGDKWADAIKAEADEPKKQTKAVELVKAAPLMIEALKADKNGGKVAVMEARAEALQKAVTAANGSISLDRPAALKGASEKVAELETKKATDAELKIAYTNLRTEASKAIDAMENAPGDFAKLTANASVAFLATADFKKAEAYLNKGVSTTPGTKGGSTPETKPEDIETKYKTQIDAIKSADTKGVVEMGKTLDKVNDEIPAADRAKVVKALEGKTTKYTIVMAGDRIDAALKGTAEGRDVDEAKTINKLVELILKFLREINVLPKEMEGKLTESRIDTKIGDLKAEKAKLDPVKDADKIKALDKYVASLEAAKPIVVEAAKFGVTVNVDADGKLSFEGPSDKVARIQALLKSLRINFRPEGGRVEIDKLDPNQIRAMLAALQQLVVAYRPGAAGYMPTNYGPGSYWANGAGAGFDANGNPNAFVGQVAYNKPQEWLGASNKKASA